VAQPAVGGGRHAQRRHRGFLMRVLGAMGSPRQPRRRRVSLQRLKCAQQQTRTARSPERARALAQQRAIPRRLLTTATGQLRATRPRPAEGTI
jgi:hypothetical protein